MDLKLRVHTNQPQAIQISTNMTKAPIPIDLDVTYSKKRESRRSIIFLPSLLAKWRVLLLSKARSRPVEVSRGQPGVQAKPTRIRILKTTQLLYRPKRSEPRAQKPLRKQRRRPDVTGWVQVGRVPVELFRRNATVQQVRVDLLPTGEQKLNGVVGINYLDYDINVLLTGTSTQPSVKFVSDPPLSDDNIMALLLFGRAPDELDQHQKDSVSNTRAALANATLGISSLYLLASTPIESIVTIRNTIPLRRRWVSVEGRRLNSAETPTGLPWVSAKN